MTPVWPLVKDVVLIGGGHTHALLLRSWGMSPIPGARLTVINPAASAPYTGMLPGYVAGHYGRDDLEIDLVRLARFAGARIVFGMVDAIDRDARAVSVAGRPPIPFDIASIDIGITSEMPEILGFTEHGIAAKPLGPFAMRWQRFHPTGGPVAVIGGGVAGVELALSMGHRMGSRGSVTLIDRSDILAGLSDATRTRLISAMSKAEIAVLENAEVGEITATSVVLKDGRKIASHFTVGAAGARAYPWLAETGLTLDGGGYVTVDETLRTSDPAVYAVGDCAHLSHAPRPKAGVFAVRAAPVLNHNIRADLIGGGLKPFRPQAHYLKLVSLGGKRALADKYGRSVEGDWAWRWKDRIDRTFMDRLNHPPAMSAPPAPANAALGMSAALGDKPLCGGCGAKVGPRLLDETLGALDMGARDDLITAAGDDAAVLTMGGAQQVISTDHLRAFWDDPYVMARIAALHALGDVWAMGAKPQIALAQITLPKMSDALQARWMNEIMSAANEVFTAEGAVIAGGHTTIGAELVIGFTVTGLADAAVTLGGAQAGDALVLTRPMGSGTLLAAEMEMHAKGTDIAELLDVLARPQGDAARVLGGYARAMTDITGFGLAGHAVRLAGTLSVEIDLDAVPLFSGAEDMAAAGVRSSIWAANMAAVVSELPDNARAALLFDPQTAGGLLAAIAPEDVEKVLVGLTDQGQQGHLIGRLTPAAPVQLRAR